jgi:hypothetical protein
MKSNFIFIFLLLIFLLNFSSAVELTLKDKLENGENFVIKVSGTFVKPLTKSNIFFYNDRGVDPVILYDFELIEGDYYIYTKNLYQKSPGNYSISLENIQYRLGGYTQTENIVSSFEILGEQAPISIKPHLVISENVYEIEIENLLSKSITISFEKKEKISEEISSSEPLESGGFLDALFNIFSSEEIDESTQTETLQVDPSEVEFTNQITLKPGEIKKITGSVQEKKGFEMINFYYEDKVYGVLIYNPKDRIVESINEAENIFEEPSITEINNVSSNETVEDISTDNDDVPTHETPGEISEELIQACQAMNGTGCRPNVEKCDGEERESKSGKCCLGECVPIKKSNTGKIVGWFIILAIVLFVTWFFKQKYRKSGPGKINLVNVARGKD